MTGAARGEREDELRTDVARVVQTLRQHLLASDVSSEVTALREPVQELANLLQADASAAHLLQAAQALVDFYDWPSPDASGGSEGPAIDAQILGAVERLRDAVDALDELDDDS
jgi:hypothetical protein